MKYVAFLRAINVGGNAIIKMADLKQMFESVGLENVQTYIQSGNVIFESAEDAASLEKLLERQLENAARYPIRLFVRTMQAVQSIARNAPFTAKEDEAVYVAFLDQKLDKKRQQVLLSLKSEADDFAIKGREIFNLRRDREKSVFSNNFLEKQLKVSATTRNLTTIQKIVEKFK
jgi:uncharacterized protein (DUF1697 family)